MSRFGNSYEGVLREQQNRVGITEQYAAYTGRHGDPLTLVTVEKDAQVAEKKMRDNVEMSYATGGNGVVIRVTGDAPQQVANAIEARSLGSVVADITRSGRAKGNVDSMDGAIDEAVDTHAVNELILFIDNDRDLYRQQFTPIIKNILKKRERGVYDHSKAPKLWLYLVDNGAKKYTQDFGTPGVPWHKQWSKATRMAAAQELADRELGEIELGNYDNLIESVDESFSHSFSADFYGDVYDANKSRRPTNVADALASMDDGDWDDMAQDVFGIPGDRLGIDDVMTHIMDTDTVGNLDSPVEVYIDRDGYHTVLVYGIDESVEESSGLLDRVFRSLEADEFDYDGTSVSGTLMTLHIFHHPDFDDELTLHDVGRVGLRLTAEHPRLLDLAIDTLRRSGIDVNQDGHIFEAAIEQGSAGPGNPPYPSDDRPSAAVRGYGHGWRKTREAYLEAHLVCEADGCEEASTTVHHKLPISEGGSDEEDNLEARCVGCHNSLKTGTTWASRASIHEDFSDLTDHAADLLRAGMLNNDEIVNDLVETFQGLSREGAQVVVDAARDRLQQVEAIDEVGFYRPSAQKRWDKGEVFFIVDERGRFKGETMDDTAILQALNLPLYFSGDEYDRKVLPKLSDAGITAVIRDVRFEAIEEGTLLERPTPEERIRGYGRVAGQAAFDENATAVRSERERARRTGDSLQIDEWQLLFNDGYRVGYAEAQFTESACPKCEGALNILGTIGESVKARCTECGLIHHLSEAERKHFDLDEQEADNPYSGNKYKVSRTFQEHTQRGYRFVDEVMKFDDVVAEIVEGDFHKETLELAGRVILKNSAQDRIHIIDMNHKDIKPEDWDALMDAAQAMQ